MISTQSVTCRYNVSEAQINEVEIRMTVRVEWRADPYAGVEITHLYEPKFPDDLQDAYFQRLNNGVNGGYALSNVTYTPDTTLHVKILELQVTPLPQSSDDEEYKTKLGYMLEMTIVGIVQTSLRSIENLRSGKETY